MVEYPIMQANYTIYVHENKINHKRYVGMTSINPKVRWQNGNNYRNCPYIQRAINKYGWDGFWHQIILTNLNYWDARVLEQMFIKALKTRNNKFGYNATDGGEGVLGVTPINYIDLTGQRFNRLTVLYRNGTYYNHVGGKKTVWHCRCDCGNELDVNGDDLKTGNTKSCGCLNSERQRERKPNKYTINQELKYVEFFTSNGHSFKVDLCDIDYVLQHTWRYRKTKNDNSCFYTTIDDVGKRKTILLKDYILRIPIHTNKHILIKFLDGDTTNFQANNLQINVPIGVSYSEYMEYVYTDNMYNVVFSQQYKMWRVYYDDNKHSKGFYTFNEAYDFWNQYGNKEPVSRKISTQSKQVICLNSLQTFESAGIASTYTTVKRAAITHACTGVNSSAGLNPNNNERLYWMYHNEYMSLNEIERKQLLDKYYTGTILNYERRDDNGD